MHVAKQFEPTRQDVIGLVAEYPLAAVTSFDGSTPHATPLPLLYHEFEDGDFLLGHFAKSNPHAMALRENPRAHIIFYGPH